MSHARGSIRVSFNAALLASLAMFSTLARGETLKIDPIHSSAIFKIKHADATNFYGTFDKTTGEIETDGDAVKSITVTIDASSLHTHNAMRDQHVSGPEFLDVKQFPEIKFVSKEVKPAKDGYEVTGDLTLHGVTKPVTLAITKTGSGEFMGKNVTGFETTFTIKRSDYGITGYIGKGVGDEVMMIVSVECSKG